MASLLATGAGAADGLESILEQMFKEQMATRQQNEAERKNRFDEGSKVADLNQRATDRQDALDAKNKATDDATQAKQDALQLRRINMRPIGSDVTPGEMSDDLKSGISLGNYTFRPANMGMSDPEKGEIGPTGEVRQWRGTQDQISKAKEKPTGGDYNVETKTVNYKGKPIDAIFDPRAYSASGTKGTYTHPETGEDITDKVQHYTAPDRVVVNTAEGLVPRGDVASRAAKGDPMEAPLPAMTRQRMYSSRQVTSHVQDIQDEIQEADQRGLIGPLEGRWGEFMRGTIGSTGDSANDELLNQLRTDLKLLGSGTMMAHFGARGGQNLIEDFNRTVLNSGKMSKDSLYGSIKSIQKWLGTYGQNPAGPKGAAAPSGGDMYDEYLKRTKKPDD